MANFQYHYNNELNIDEFVKRNYDELCRRYGHFEIRHKDTRNNEIALHKSNFCITMRNYEQEFQLRKNPSDYHGIKVLSLKYVPTSVSGKDYDSEVDWLIAVVNYIHEKRTAAKAKRDVKNTQKKLKTTLEFMGKDEEILRAIAIDGWEETKSSNGRTWNQSYKDHGELRRQYNCGKDKSLSFYIGTTKGTMTLTATGLDAAKVVEIIKGLTANMRE